MIQDLFFQRYSNEIYWGDNIRPEHHRLFIQIGHIVFNDLTPQFNLDQNFFQIVHDALARELGIGRLFDAPKYDLICGRFLTEPYDLWNDRHGSPDNFLKGKLSLVELIFRTVEDRLHAGRNSTPRSSLTQVWRRPIASTPQGNVQDSLSSAIEELNARLRSAGIPLHYHSGLLQLAHDELTEKRNAEPCWTLLRDPKWSNVDRELKEALDRADNREIP